MRPISIIILTWNGLDFTRLCLTSLREKTPAEDNYRVIVVDNGSTDGTIAYLESLPWITLIRNDRNLGFVKGNNIGIGASDPASDLVLLNNDMIITQPDWLKQVRRLAESDPDIGIIGVRLLDGKGTFLHAGTFMPLATFWGQHIGNNEKNINQFNQTREVESVVAACMYIRRELVEKIGMLDEAFFSYFEDTDFCLRARKAGFKVVCAGGPLLVHFENTSTKVNKVDFSDMFKKSQRIFIGKWKKYLQDCYDVNLAWTATRDSQFRYDKLSRQAAIALDEAHVAVHLTCPLEGEELETSSTRYKLNEMRMHSTGSRIPEVWCGPAEISGKRKARYRIGFRFRDPGMAENNRDLQHLDELWVPSAFERDELWNLNVRQPIHIMPIGVNADYLNPNIKAYRTTNRFVFLSAFTGNDAFSLMTVLRSYLEEFSSHEAVLLILRDERIDRKIHLKNLLRPLQKENSAPICWLRCPLLPGYQTASLYRSCDCFIMPSFTASGRISTLEAMACGLPVIAPDGGPYREFVSEDHAYPLSVNPVRSPLHSDTDYHAHLDTENLRLRMREVFRYRTEAEKKGLLASQTVLQRWTWRHTAQCIKNRLREIGL